MPPRAHFSAFGLLAMLAAGLGAATTAPAARAEDTHPAAAASAAARTPRPADAKLYIISPRDGETVKSPVTVRFGLSGMGVAPAGVASPNTGHHHLLVDSPVPPADQAVPKDDKHLHFGAGQTEATIPLPPGKHTLELVLADKDHLQFDPTLVSNVVHITVK